MTSQHHLSHLPKLLLQCHLKRMEAMIKSTHCWKNFSLNSKRETKNHRPITCQNVKCLKLLRKRNLLFRCVNHRQHLWLLQLLLLRFHLMKMEWTSWRHTLAVQKVLSDQMLSSSLQTCLPQMKNSKALRNKDLTHSFKRAATSR